MNASPPEPASLRTTNAEQQPPSSSAAHQHQQQHLLQQEHSSQQSHHAHCSYEKEVVCDESQMHELQRHQRYHAPPHDQHPHGEHAQHYRTPHDQLPPQPKQKLHQHHQHRHHLHRKQNSPHSSRHTSPHSHHSHSLHSSPHQSHAHVHACNSADTRRSSVDSPAYKRHQQIISHTNSSHSSHHHHVHRRRKRQSNNQHLNGPHNGNSSGSHGAHSMQHDRSSILSRTTHETGICSGRHRSATDVSSTSINTCNEGLGDDREVQEILVRKNCCISRSELAQYFAEDLYGSARRPSSCCTSSDYCYHTDSTSLYGSRSSLSRNNSIKSASVTMRKRLMQHRQPSYTSISLRGLNASRPNSQLGSLTSIFDRAKQIAESNSAFEGSGKVILSPSKVTIERQSSSKDALNKELPEYACSPSPIRWSFLADEKTSLDSQGAVGGEASNGTCNAAHKRDSIYEREHCRHDHGRDRPPTHTRAHDERPATSSTNRRCRESPFSCELEESTTVLFHQESEAFNNCCNNYVQCNTYLDQDLQITSEDIHQYLSKGNQQIGDILNNSKNYPFQPSNVFEFQYKNNFANNNAVSPLETSDSIRGSYDGRVRRNSSKETNLNQNAGCEASGCVASSCTSTSLSPTDINLSSSTNNINIVFNSYAESNANEVKFINTTRENAVSTEAHHSGYLPYTYPSYDYTNMSANSQFGKTAGIDTTLNAADPGTDSPPVAFGVDLFDSLDASSDNNLLSQRSSCHFSPTTPGSPVSPVTTSSISASIDTAYYQQRVGRRDSHLSTAHSPSTRHHHDPYRHSHHHFTEGLKFSNAFKRVRKRARKYTDFLRKK